MFISKVEKEDIFDTLEATADAFAVVEKLLGAIRKTHERDLGLVNEEIRVAAKVYISFVKSMSNLKVAMVATEIETKKRFEELYEFLGVSRFEREDGSYELIGNDELEAERVLFDAPATDTVTVDYDPTVTHVDSKPHRCTYPWMHFVGCQCADGGEVLMDSPSKPKRPKKKKKGKK